MKINIVRAENIDLTDALRTYVEKKLRKISKTYVRAGDESAICDIELGKTTHHHKAGDIFHAEFNLHIAGKDLYVEAQESDLYAAIDEAQDELRRQLKSHREKRLTLIRKGGKRLKDLVRGFTGRS